MIGNLENMMIPLANREGESLEILKIPAERLGLQYQRIDPVETRGGVEGGGVSDLSKT